MYTMIGLALKVQFQISNKVLVKYKQLYCCNERVNIKGDNGVEICDDCTGEYTQQLHKGFS